PRCGGGVARAARRLGARVHGHHGLWPDRSRDRNGTREQAHARHRRALGAAVRSRARSRRREHAGRRKNEPETFRVRRGHRQRLGSVTYSSALRSADVGRPAGRNLRRRGGRRDSSAQERRCESTSHRYCHDRTPRSHPARLTTATDSTDHTDRTRGTTTATDSTDHTDRTRGTDQTRVSREIRGINRCLSRPWRSRLEATETIYSEATEGAEQETLVS